MVQMIATREAEKCILEFARLFPGWLLVSKRLDPGSIHPTKPLCALARTPTGRDDTVCSLGALFRGQVVVSKKLDPGSSTFARDDTVNSLG